MKKQRKKYKCKTLLQSIAVNFLCHLKSSKFQEESKSYKFLSFRDLSSKALSIPSKHIKTPKITIGLLMGRRILPNLSQNKRFILHQEL